MCFQVLCLFFNLFVVVLLLLLSSYRNSFFILDINSLSGTFCKYIFPFHRLPFHSFDCILWCTEVFNFYIMLLAYFCFYYLFFFCHSKKKKSLPKPYVEVFFLCFLLWFVFVSGPTYRTLTHFELIFLYGIRQEPNFILLHVDTSYPSNICWEGTIKKQEGKFRMWDSL